jgi:hypothetical protein
MFDKLSKKSMSVSSEKFDTLIGRTTVIQGTLILRDSVRIDGKVLGNIEADAGSKITVAIGPTGEIKGDITATSGSFTGSLTVGTDAWHVDTSGNMWWGSSVDYAGATIKVSAAGSVNFTTGTFSGALNVGSNAWHVDTSGNMWWGASATYADATIKISSAGSVSLTTGTFSGAISGSAITGSTITTAATGLRTILNSNNLRFYNSDAQRGFLRPDSTNGLVLGTQGSVYFTDLTGNPNIEFTSGGSIHISASLQHIRFASGRQIEDASSAIRINGDITATGTVYPDGDVRCGGTFKSSDGSNGLDISAYNFVTTLRYNSGAIEYKTRAMTFKDGILTGMGNESGWVRT